MLELSQLILDKYQVRKTKKQKSQFIQLLKENLPHKSINIEQGGFLKNRNIVIGDYNKANVIVTAHYDTQSVLPFPNFLTPENLFFFILYNLLIVAVFLAGFILIRIIIDQLPYIPYLIPFAFLVYYFLFFGLFFFGKANKHTANDNTSGVIGVLEIMDKVQSDNVCYVLFDHEEVGLLGSMFFKKKHAADIYKKIIINLDCISDGDHIMVVQSAEAAAKYGNIIEESFKSKDNKNIVLTYSKNTIYPSDQVIFNQHLGIAAFKKNKILGYYMNRIHTSRDTVFDVENIIFIRDNIINFINNLENSYTNHPAINPIQN